VVAAEDERDDLIQQYHNYYYREDYTVDPNCMQANICVIMFEARAMVQQFKRYTNGLTSTQVSDRFGNLVPNPLFAGGRSPGDVFLTGIVGVPWQNIAREANGGPDLTGGLDNNGQPVGGYQSAAELAQNGRWDVIVGDVDAYIDPTDPLMRESITPRSGQNPITGDAIAGPNAGYLANPINGHEYTNDADDLQYACIYPLPQPVDCSQVGFSTSCECKDPNNDNPVCQAPGGAQTTTQYFAKAYPGRRQLSVIQSLGAQGVVGSICPAQLDDPANATYAYQPTMQALAEALTPTLSD
jgi:hypothetical protein